jgi:hypothetical protein
VNPAVREILVAVRDEKVIAGTRQLAKHILEEEDRRLARAETRKAERKARPKKDLGGATAHHAKVRRQEDLDEEKAKRAMHDAVFAWNIAHGGRCDCGCGYLFRHATEGECDHWAGRKGEGAHTRENGWRLRHDCHEDKTHNRPSRQEWNRRRFAYCQRAGIPYVERRVK